MIPLKALPQEVKKSFFWFNEIFKFQSYTCICNEQNKNFKAILNHNIPNSRHFFFSRANSKALASTSLLVLL